MNMFSKGIIKNLEDQISKLTEELNVRDGRIFNLEKEVIRLREENASLSNKDNSLSDDIITIQKDYSLEISKLTSDVYKNANEINDNITSQSAYQEEMLASLEEIRQNVASVTANVNKAYDSRLEDGKITKTVHDGIVVVDEVVTDLNEDLKKINMIVDAINGFSEQTKLLGLNARIESARAGEAGKGFAVVANEIQKLSNETKDAAGSILELVQRILDKSNNALQNINKVAENSDIILENNINSIDNISMINSALNEINAAVGESTKSAEFSSNNLVNVISKKANAICDDIRIKPASEVRYIGSNFKLQSEQEINGGSYKIKRSPNKVMIIFNGMTIKDSTFREKYAEMVSSLNVADHELILDARGLGIFIGAMKSKLAPMYQQYAKYKRVYIVTGSNHSMKMQLTNVFMECGIENKFEFIDDYIESEEPVRR